MVAIMLTLVPLSMQGYRDGHHHDRSPERRQDIVAESIGGEFTGTQP